MEQASAHSRLNKSDDKCCFIAPCPTLSVNKRYNSVSCERFPAQQKANGSPKILMTHDCGASGSQLTSTPSAPILPA